MKQTGIIMSGNHPKLILDGIKTMTRRVAKSNRYTQWQFDNAIPHNVDVSIFENTETGIKSVYLKMVWDEKADRVGGRLFSPYEVGDRLWVRETWEKKLERYADVKGAFVYKADYDRTFEDVKWKPSIHMPRWASRITLKITEVRVERLQEIDYFGARAEGILSFNREHPDHTNGGVGYNRGKAGLPMRYESTAAFMDLWDSLNAERGYGWEVNPWVWVISFKVVKC